MRKQIFYAALVLATVAGGLAGPAYAQAKVNIVYPINGASYPIADPGPPALRSAYFTASFSVTCSGGRHKVKWGFDRSSVGKETFYDQTSVQQVYKLPGGNHVFWVRSDCGKKSVKFRIGS